MRAPPLLALLACALLAHSAHAWVWQGALTASSVRLKTSCVEEPVLVAVIRDRANAAEIPARLIAQTEGICELALDNLFPSTRYRWTLKETGKADVIGVFTTAPQPGVVSSYSVAFSANSVTDSDTVLYRILPSYQPLVFLHLGDLHRSYPKDTNARAFLDLYNRTLSLSSLGYLLREVPVNYQMNTADFGPLNVEPGRDAPTREAATQAYQVAAVSHATVAGKLYTSFVLGRVLFISLDTSSERQGESALGREQLAWLESLLEMAYSQPTRYAQIVMMSPMLWISVESGWGLYAVERAHIAQVVTKYQLASRMVILCGGSMLAVDDGSNSVGLIPVFVAGALDAPPRIAGGPFSHGAAAGSNQVGIMEIKDSGSRVCIMLTQYSLRAKLISMMMFDTCNSKWSVPDFYKPSPPWIRHFWSAVTKRVETDRVFGTFVGPMVDFVESNGLSLFGWQTQVIAAALFVGIATMLLLVHFKLLPKQWPEPGEQEQEKKEQ